MPQTKSAKKALRQSKRKRLVNLAILKKLKAAIKKFKKNPNSDDFIAAQSRIDIATKKRVITKNKAARLKSNLSKLLPKDLRSRHKPTKGLTKSKRASNLKKTKSK